MRMPKLKALARERGLRKYSRLRKAKLIQLIQNDQRPLQSWDPSIPCDHQAGRRAPNRPRPAHPNRPPPPPPRTSTWDPRGVPGPAGPWEPIDDGLRPKLEAPLTKRQLKHRQNKNSKLAKEFKNLEAEINNLKSQMDSSKNRITKASESANARFKRKKIRSMKRDFDKINEKLKESEAKLESVEQ